MRLWILGILLLVLLVVLLRAAFWGRPDPVSGRRFPRFTVITLVIIIGVIGWFEWRWRDMQQQATIVVQQVIQRHDASVECQRTGAALLFAGNESGHVIYEEGDHLNTGSVALLAYETCGDLGSWLRSDKTNSTPEAIVAVHVLTHEAVHVAGIRNEAETECLAMRIFPEMAQELGASPAEAERMARHYRSIVWPTLRSNYRADCAKFDSEPFPPSENP